MELLVERWARLGELLESRAPIPLVAAQAQLVGRAGVVLDPDGCAKRDADRIAIDFKQDMGLCMEPGCDAGVLEAVQEIPVLCDEHRGSIDVGEVH